MLNLSHVTLHEMVDDSTPSDKLFAMLLAVVSTFGLVLFCSFIEKIVVESPLVSPIVASQWRPGNMMPSDTFWELLEQVKYNGNLLRHMKPAFTTLMKPIEVRVQAWLLFFAIPCSFARHVQATSDKKSTGSMAAKFKCATPVVKASCHVTSVIGHSAARLAFSFQCSADSPGWADFYLMQPDGSIAQQTAKGKGKSKLGQRSEYADQGFRVGDIVRFQFSWHNLNLPSISCIAVVTSKSVYQTKGERKNRVKHFSKISSLNLIVSFLPENLLQLSKFQAVIEGIACGRSVLPWSPGDNPSFDVVSSDSSFFSY